MNPHRSDLALEEQFFVTRRAQLERWLPWLKLFRAIRIAIDPRKLALSLFAVWLWAAGGLWIETYLSLMFGGDAGEAVLLMSDPVEFAELTLVAEDALLEEIGTDPSNEGFPVEAIFGGGGDAVGFFSIYVLKPGWKPLGTLFFPQFMRSSVIDQLRELLKFLWGLIVAAFFGGAICRMAAAEFSGTGHVSLRSALGFSRRKFFSFLGGPLLPLVGIGFFWILNALIGLVAMIPYFGDGLVGALWIVPLTFGFLIALIALGVQFGWPLMLAGVATESTDAFDALSRSYSYLFGRSRYFFGLLLFMTAAGAVMLRIVVALYSLSLQYATNTMYSGDMAEFSIGNMDSLSFLGQQFITYWYLLLAMLPEAFAFSYFWSAMTIIYFLLRLSVDATPLTEIDMGGNKATPLPLVGIPAARRREELAKEEGGGSRV